MSRRHEVKAVRCPKCKSSDITRRCWELKTSDLLGFDEFEGFVSNEQERFLHTEKPALPEYYCYGCNSSLEEIDLVITDEDVEED